jgi:RimJ/RimL family protein N-acetyltransferase
VDEVEVGYGFMPEYWGRGLATEIAQACIRLGFNQLGLKTLVAVTTHANVASQYVMRKAGMIYDRDIVHAGAPHVLYRINGKM